MDSPSLFGTEKARRGGVNGVCKTMNFIRAIIGILVVLFLAFIMGKNQNSRHPAVHFYTWIGAITVLLLIRWFL